VASSPVTPSYPGTLTDNFNRSGSLGTSSDGSSSWTVLSGDWTANSTAATSSTNGIASVTLSGSTITNMQVDIPDSAGGVGPAFWIQDANNYYAADVTYTTRIGTACNSYAFLSSPGGCNPGGCDNGQLYDAYCTVLGNWGQVFAYSFSEANSQNNSTCSSFGASGAGVSFSRNASFCQTLGNVTTYDTDFGVRKVVNGTTTRDFMTIASSQSSYTTIGSVKVSTSGTYVTAVAYTGQSLGGSQIQSFGSNQGDRVATSKVGLFRGSSAARQGSTLDNISVTVS
jgi:hypothetical protein